MDNQEIIPESFFIDTTSVNLLGPNYNPLCLPLAFANHNYTKQVMAKSIFFYFLKNKHDKIVFPQFVEGLNASALFYIDDIVKILHHTYKIPLDKFVYFTSCFPVESNLKAYKKIVSDYNLLELPIYFTNCYEYFAIVDAIKNIELINGKTLSYETKERPFLFLNGQARAHRIIMIGEIFARNIHPFTFLSCYDNDIMEQARSARWVVDKQVFGPRFFRLFYEIETRKEIFPLKLTGNNVHDYSLEDHDLYKKSYISIVSETDFFQIHYQNKTVSFNCTYPTEKTFRPIKARHPFIIASRPHFLKHLRSQGYKTFHPHINEYYDDLDNDEQRMTAIVSEMERLSKYSDEEWASFLYHTNHICQHNFETLILKEPHMNIKQLVQ